MYTIINFKNQTIPAMKSIDWYKLKQLGIGCAFLSFFRLRCVHIEYLFE